MEDKLMINEFGEAIRSINAATQAIAAAANVNISQAPTRLVERWVEFAASENATVTPDALKIDNDVEEVLGIRLDSLNAAQVALRGSIGITMSGKEVIRRGYLAKGLYASEHVQTDARHYTIGFPVKVGSNDISISYTDTANAAAPFGSGYKVRLVMLCKLK